jgi:hypothetical protein
MLDVICGISADRVIFALIEPSICKTNRRLCKLLIPRWKEIVSVMSKLELWDG